MILYNQELGETDCEFNPDNNTKQFLVAFFGFYRHDIANDFESFLKELEIKDVINDDEANIFKLDGEIGLEAYNCCDRRTFDVAIILPKTFSTETEALDWFNKKIKDSDHIKKSEICQIGVVDAKKLLVNLGVQTDYTNKVKAIDEAFKNNIKELEKKMLEEFKHDPDYSEIIKEKFISIF